MRGIGFVVRAVDVAEDEEVDDAMDGSFGNVADPNATLLTLDAKNISIADALDLVCEKAGLQWEIDEKSGKITIVPTDPIMQKLAGIRIPRYELVEENLSEAVAKLMTGYYVDDESSESVDLAMSYVVRNPKNLSDDEESKEAMIPYTKKVSLVIEDLEYPELMDLICEKFGVAWKIDEYAITVYPIGMNEMKVIPIEDPDDPFSGASEQDPEFDPFGQ